MSLGDYLTQAAPPEREPRPVDVPKGWEPGVRWSAKTGTGTITTTPLASEPDGALWAELIADWGLDPAALEIEDGSIELIGWDSQIKGTGTRLRLKRYKARLRKRAVSGDSADVDALCKAAERRKPPRRTVTADGDRALVVAAGDWQLGKGEGDGSEGTVNRIVAASGRIIDRLKELQRAGRPVTAVYVIGMGDLVEQCSGNYASQEFTTDLTRREQMRVARRLLLQLVDFIVDAGYPVVLSAVAGNHGENRKNGKAFTTPEDNDDLAVIEQVGEVLAANPDRYSHVSVFLPEWLSMTLDICGVPVGFYHGHGATRGGTAPAKIDNWWTGQIKGRQPTADAQILVTGHYHHLTVTEASGRTQFQCPSMDPGSRWFQEVSGASSPAGLLTFVAGTGCGPRGWDDMAVL